MRTSNYRKFKITKKQSKLVGGAAAVAVLAGIIFFFAFFHVSKVEVMESNHYTKEELKKMVLTGAFSSNSVLAPITCSKNNVQGVPYIEGYSVSRSGRNSIVISVREKSVVGCIPYLDSYVYFDRNGMFVEGDKTRDESVPYFEGIQVKKVVMNEKLPIKDAVLNTAVALSTIFAKNALSQNIYIRTMITPLKLIMETSRKNLEKINIWKIKCPEWLRFFHRLRVRRGSFIWRISQKVLKQ